MNRTDYLIVGIRLPHVVREEFTPFFEDPYNPLPNKGLSVIVTPDSTYIGKVVQKSIDEQGLYPTDCIKSFQVYYDEVKNLFHKEMNEFAGEPISLFVFTTDFS